MWICFWGSDIFMVKIFVIYILWVPLQGCTPLSLQLRSSPLQNKNISSERDDHCDWNQDFGIWHWFWYRVEDQNFRIKGRPSTIDLVHSIHFKLFFKYFQFFVVVSFVDFCTLPFFVKFVWSNLWSTWQQHSHKSPLGAWSVKIKDNKINRDLFKELVLLFLSPSVQ